MADDYVREIEALFTRFIHIEDASERILNPEIRRRLNGKRWGWIVSDNLDALGGTWEPGFMGIKESQQEATDAAVGYIWKMRGDLVAQCKRELSKMRSYATSRASGNTGMHVV